MFLANGGHIVRLDPDGLAGNVLEFVEAISGLGLGLVPGQFAHPGAEPGGGPPEQLAAYIAREIPKWAKIVKAAKIT